MHCHKKKAAHPFNPCAEEIFIRHYRQELSHENSIIRVAEYYRMRRGHGNTPHGLPALLSKFYTCQR